MAKIENTTVYPIKSTPSADDYFIITDTQDDNSTKNCKISSISASVNLYEKEVTVPSANIRVIANNMFTLIPAVSGKYIIPISFIAKLEFGTIVYDFGAGDNLYITTSSSAANAYSSVLGVLVNSPSNLTTAGTCQLGMTNGGIIKGEPLVLWGAGTFSDATQGDGDLKINIQYRLVSI